MTAMAIRKANELLQQQSADNNFDNNFYRPNYFAAHEYVRKDVFEARMDRMEALLKQTVTEMKYDNLTLKTELKDDMKNLRAELKDLRTELKNDIKVLDTKIDAKETKFGIYLTLLGMLLSVFIFIAPFLRDFLNK